MGLRLNVLAENQKIKEKVHFILRQCWVRHWKLRISSSDNTTSVLGEPGQVTSSFWASVSSFIK